jgi:DNA-binding beta-propeller fold protein YncE
MQRSWRLAPLAVLVISLTWLAPAARAAERVYWGGYGDSNPKISFANLNNTGGGADLNTTGATVSEPFGIGLDIVGGRIYWANDSGDTISFANLNGSGGGGDLNTSGATMNNPEGFAIDPVAGRVYWSNGSGNKISFANLDGSGGGDLNTSGATVSRPNGLAIDSANGRIYWPNYDLNTISFANLNGSGGGGGLNTSGATVMSPEGVAIDPVAGKIYWANNAGNSISFANLNNTGGGNLNTTGATMDGPLGLGIDPAAGKIYWANDGASNKISFANLNNTGGGGDLNTAGATVHGPAFATLLKTPSGTGSPAITGGSAPGTVLSCSLGSWAPDLLGSFLYQVPKSFAYQWSRDGNDVAGATASTYTATAEGDYRCTVTASNDAGSSSQTSAPHAVLLASLSRYSISPRSFVATRSGPSARSAKRKKKRKKSGGKVSFRLNEAASVTFKVKQRVRGRRDKRGRCVKRTRKNRKKRKCIRVVTLRGGFTRAGAAGANSFRFTGRLRKRTLRPGRYLLVATPTADGKSGLARSTSFRIKRPHR